ncbi:alpha-1,3-mannosyl-glycoprotein 4-beta-N-acetylglucosaminyltransferase C-like [Lethenteron reissneri]|uniref:alpha-1,3-mannosyl-glycoprotein 4-beta-N-acetylglucosaminyltransferase C-like n=1 Tax=Lethenteron reissneri TaxID=7753 RepID=UPI002AB6292A|nr:alpha-1,3-mannosyl-glycoprotein 4-beta-N-acetylglucosaminyltransferase C-like [Lethenteron reissneri]XP_061422624.1 alpha-1,3-mannosyl-glycoprotein 4-beta-N-acetylglucosaminyltransferase C-like [Lethenteron reissneri]
MEAMRCSRKRVRTQFGVGLVTCVLSTLLLLFLIDEELSGFGENEEQRIAKEVLLKQLYSEKNELSFRNLSDIGSLLNITYYHLAGYPSNKKKYLTIGISSVKRARGNYLLQTLKSIFEQSSDEELADMVIVVHLADFDAEWCEGTARAVARKFSQHVMRGRLVVIHAPRHTYPPLQGLKRNFDDPDDRVTFRSKQNVDYAFLTNFCANLSENYLMLEDDVACSRNFLTYVRKFVSSLEGQPWATLEFSKLGYIGKLYRSCDLPRLARFLLMFYQEMPCDWLLNHFRTLLAQGDAIRFKPSLFQHMGYYSSFRGTANKLKDDDFEDEPSDVPDNPPALLRTNIEVFEAYHPYKAYGLGGEYFWGKAPSVGKFFLLVFKKAAKIEMIKVRTGTEDRKGDVLRHAALAVGDGLKPTSTGRDCSNYVPLGEFADGQFDSIDVLKMAPFEITCLRINVLSEQSDWVIIRNIGVWTAQTP